MVSLHGHAVALRVSNLVAKEHVQAVGLVDLLVVVDSIGPAVGPTIALVELGSTCVLYLTRRVVEISVINRARPITVLRPAAAHEELGVERKVLEYVPGEATGATQGLAFLERLIIVDTGIRAIGFPKRLLAVVLDVAFEKSCHIAIFLHIGIRDGAETIGVGKDRPRCSGRRG